MNRTPVSSSNVGSVGYEAGSMTLEVEYLSGSVYQYFDVPEYEYDGLMSAESVGRYVNQNIKPNYRCARI